MRNYASEYKSATDTYLDLVQKLTLEDLDKRDSTGWSPRQVIHHMADSEAQSYARLRRLIAEPGTAIQGYDEGKWAESETLAYKTAGIEGAIAVFKAVRQASYELITRIDNAQLKNEGIHTESGRYTVEIWLDTYINHPLDHANQIRNQI